jgi:hypothetical protein
MGQQSLRRQIPDAHKWEDLKELYRDIHFTTEPCEEVEACGVTEHDLGNRLSNLQTFWNHVAPATHRKHDTHLASNVAEVITRIAQRSYEVYANVFDALEELKSIEDNGPQKPRYRSCLNVLRCIGDACQLFDDLIYVLGEKSDFNQRGKKPANNLAAALGSDIYFFKDWSSYWSTERMHVADYRHMLVHHGRPWLFLKTKRNMLVGPLCCKLKSAVCVAVIQRSPSISAGLNKKLYLARTVLNLFYSRTLARRLAQRALRTAGKIIESIFGLSLRYATRSPQRFVAVICPSVLSG